MAVSFADPDALIPSHDVAEFRHVKPGTLAVERHRGQGPPYVLLGRRVYYRARDLAAWLDANTVIPQRG